MFGKDVFQKLNDMIEKRESLTERIVKTGEQALSDLETEKIGLQAEISNINSKTTAIENMLEDL